MIISTTRGSFRNPAPVHLYHAKCPLVSLMLYETVQLGVLIFLNGAMENSVYSRRFVFVFISKQMRANQPWTLTEN